mgnify:CR=1 FL=1
MELKLVIKTGRSAVVEFDDGGKYYSKEEYTLLEKNMARQKRLLQQYMVLSQIQNIRLQRCMQEKNMDLLNLRRIMNM